MTLDSPEIHVDKSAQEVYDFLSKVENFEKLMPDSISKFEILESDTFLFALKGMPEIVLKKKEMREIGPGVDPSVLPGRLRMVSSVISPNSLQSSEL